MTSRVSLFGIIIWFICAIFFMYEFLLRTILGTFENQIISDLNLTLVSFAILSSTSYQLIYGTMQVPVGFIVDRLGLKFTLFMATCVCALGVFLFGISNTFGSAVIYRVMMGFGSSFGFICLLVAVYEWLPKKNVAFFIGLSQFIGTMGPMLAAGPLNYMSSSADFAWREVFYILSLLGIILAVLILFIVKNNSSEGKFKVLQMNNSVYNNLISLIRQPQVWFIAIFSAGVYFSIEYLSENSGKHFLELHGYSSNVSSYMITLSWFGYAIGCPLLGIISDMISRRKILLVASAFFCLFSLLVIFYFPINVFLLGFAFILLGIGSSGQSIGFAIMAEQCSDNYLAAGLGFNNGIIMLFVSILSPFIGWMLSLQQSVNISSYQKVFLIIILLVLSAMFISIFCIKETFCKSNKSVTKLNLISK